MHLTASDEASVQCKNALVYKLIGC